MISNGRESKERVPHKLPNYYWDGFILKAKKTGVRVGFVKPLRQKYQTNIRGFRSQKFNSLSKAQAYIEQCTRKRLGIK